MVYTKSSNKSGECGEPLRVDENTGEDWNEEVVTGKVSNEPLERGDDRTAERVGETGRRGDEVLRAYFLEAILGQFPPKPRYLWRPRARRTSTPFVAWSVRMLNQKNVSGWCCGEGLASGDSFAERMVCVLGVVRAPIKQCSVQAQQCY